MQKLNTQRAILATLIPLASNDPTISAFVLGISVILMIKAELE